MENIIFKELYQNAKKIADENFDYSPTYNEMRKSALSFFESVQIPTKKNENWLYTSIAKNLAPRFLMETNDRNFESDYVIDKENIIIFNNGHFNRSHSKLPMGFTKSSPVLTKKFHDAFDALNMTSAKDALSFNISKDTVLKTPITILHLTDELGVNKHLTPRVHFNIEKNCELTIVEVFTSTQNELFQYTTNAQTSFCVHENAKIKHIKVNLDAAQSTHISLTRAEIEQHASFETFSIDLGNLMTRNNLEIHLNAPNAFAGVHGLFNLKKSEHADVFSSIFHHAPHTNSEQLYKGILGDQSHGAFTGKVEIDPQCEQANAAQLNKNLLLSKKAHINTRPQLLVATDDVKCAHGATIGELSSEEEFYLTSRGISKSKARKMLALGFAHEILYKMNNQKVFDFVHKFLEKAEFNL